MRRPVAKLTATRAPTTSILTLSAARFATATKSASAAALHRTFASPTCPAPAARRRYSQQGRPASVGPTRRNNRLLLGAVPVIGVLSAAGLALNLGQRRGLASMASSKLTPSNPAEVMVIRDLTPNVVTLSVPFMRFGTLAIGGRATVVRLSSGALAVFSPVALTPEVKAKLAGMGGDLRYIVATDIEHHIFVSQWAAEFPGARIVGPEGLPEKRAKAAGKDPMIGQEPFAAVFTAEAKRAGALPSISDEFDADFAVEYVDAHANKELVFLYKPDRVLIEADLMFNLPATEQYSRVPEADRPKEGPIKRFFAGMQSTAGDATAAKRFLWYVLSAKDRPGFNASCRRIDAWDFDTIIPCHGDTIQGNGKEVFRKVFAWHLEAAAAAEAHKK